ncbi:MAG: S8 family serine peptidase [Tangfeifania sp.]
MKNFIILFIIVISIFAWLPSSGQSFFWVGFTDKKGTPYSLSFPEDFLSERAIQRREKQNIAIDSLDLPPNPDYIQQVLNLGADCIHSSRWLNGVTVFAQHDSFQVNVLKLPFVEEVVFTKPGSTRKSVVNKFADPMTQGETLKIDTLLYGSSVFQVGQLNGQFLHNQDFKGGGMHIAVLDAGFYRANQYSAFDSLWINNRILGVKDFVNKDFDAFEMHYHGMSVLSIMGGNVPGKLIGTAPEASYWLLRSEDIGSEYLIEEDNWVVAAEFADSAGADIINSSLGYFEFDDPEMNHTYEDMDGKTTRVTQAANIAASRGMLVFSSAGNEGNNKNGWKYIIAPSDGDSVVAVGAVNSEGSPAPFTSCGPASDGDVKPNVSAVGWNTTVQLSNGTIGFGNGTSYSSPVMAGAAACLWQANPFAGASHVKNAIEESAHLFGNPDSLLGYGIPDMKIADKILKSTLMERYEVEGHWLVYPNPVVDYLVLQKKSNLVSDKLELAFYTPDGRLIGKEIKTDASKILMNDLSSLPSGVLLLQIIADEAVQTVKIFKSF